MKKLFFHANHQVDIPTLLLEAKSGTVYGCLDGFTGLKYTRNLTSANEISLSVTKYLNGKLNPLWNCISDLKTISIPEYNEKFQIKVTYNDEETETKSITGTALAEAELSQTLLRNFECNTDTDLETNNYRITKFYDETDEDFSLLHRVLRTKASHYKIAHVDETLKDFAYEYSANEKSIYDFLVGDVAEQMQCLFVFDSISRSISVYDLCSTCNHCAEETIEKQYDSNGNELTKPYRDDFHGECPKCHSADIKKGYGSDTTILIDRENLANSIVTETDVDSLKNCLYVEGGDENINAAFLMLNPCGGQYIYYFSPEVLSEMPEEFQKAYQDYTAAYNHYYNENVTDSTKTTHEYVEQRTETTVLPGKGETNTIYPEGMYEKTYNPDNPDSNYIHKFNAVVEHISNLSNPSNPSDDNTYSEYKNYKSDTSFSGQSSLVAAYYRSTSLQSFIQTAMQPVYDMETYDKYHALAMLTSETIGTVGIAGFSSTTPETTVQRAILKYAKAVINTSMYTVDIKSMERASGNNIYNVVFSITDLQEENTKINTITNTTFRNVAVEENYSDAETLNAIQSVVSISVDGNVKTYCKNKISDIISKSKLPKETSLYELDESILSENDFKQKINLYSIDNLTIIHDVMQSCIDVLSDDTLINPNDDAISRQLASYKDIYAKRQAVISNRIRTLSNYAFDVKMYGMLLLAYIREIKDELNFEEYLNQYPSSRNLLNIFNYYRREGTYKNEHIISEGLDDSSLIKHAGYLMEFAKKEAIKAGTPQITVTNSLNNLLALPEFEPIVDDFEVGNWIKIRTNIDDSAGKDTIYNLRLLSYTISFDDIQNIDVEFSTAANTWSGIRDVNDVIESAQNMSTSFNYISRQVEKSSNAASIVDTWVNDSLDLTSQKITSQANDQSIVMDSHGILARKYDELSDTYDDCQLKIFNNGLYFTNDNWKNIKTGIGKFKYLDPQNDFAEREGYGVIADTVMSDIILTQKLGIYNSNGSICFNEDGFLISGNEINGAKNSFSVNPNDKEKMLKITKKTSVDGTDKTEDVFYTDSNGNLHMVGIMDINGGYFRGDIQAEGKISGGKIIGAGIEGGSLSIGNGKLTVDDTQCSIHGDITAEALTIKDRISVSGIGDILDCNKTDLLRNYLKLGILPKTCMEMVDNGETNLNGYAGKISLCSSSVEIPGSLTVDQGIDGTLNGCAAKLANSGNVSAPMTFHWNGQAGQPTWIWGGNDGSNMYVYNPANFSVKEADSAKCVYTHLKSAKNDHGDRFQCRITKNGEFRPDDIDDSEKIDNINYIYTYMNLGNSNYPWGNIFTETAPIDTSDRNYKSNIHPLKEQHLKFFQLLQPVSFTFKKGTSGRTHIGFISQDVEAAMKEVGLTDLDFAGFCKDIKTITRKNDNGDEVEEPVLDANGNPEYIYSLRYEEFIAINTYAIQHLMAELNNTKSELSALKETVNNLIKSTNYKEENT